MDPYMEAELRWRLNDPVMRKHQEFLDRLEQMENGKFRFLVVVGPPGINKSGTMKDFLHQIYWRAHQTWAAIEPADMRPKRRTNWNTFNEPVFIDPFIFRGGDIQPHEFFTMLQMTSDPGEWLVLDDLESLNERKNRYFLQGATDVTRGGEFVRMTKRTAQQAKRDDIPQIGKHQGNIVILTNHRRRGSDIAQDVFGQAAPQSGGRRRGRPKRKESEYLNFGDALENRAHWIEYPWDPEALVDFIDHTAFTKSAEEGGLFARLRDSDNPALPEDIRGLGFTGSDDEAIAMLRDVREFFLREYKRMRVCGYRALYAWLSDRLWTPDEWRERAEPWLFPKA